jgi:hypothetical protein
MREAQMRREGIRRVRSRGRMRGLLGLGLLATLLVAAPALGAPAARDAGGSYTKFDPKTFCFQGGWLGASLPQFCGFPHNGTGAPLTMTSSSLRHGMKWVNAKAQKVNGGVLINDYATNPTDGTSIPDGARAAFMAVGNGLVGLNGSMTLSNSQVTVEIPFWTSHADFVLYDCEVITPKPPTGWTCAMAIWAGDAVSQVAVGFNTYCCVSHKLDATPAPALIRGPTRTAPMALTQPVECEATQPGSCRGMLSLRAGNVTQSTRFVVPRGTQRNIALRLPKPLTRRSARRFQLQLFTIQPDGRAVRTYEHRGRAVDLLARAR